jgi:hypothetical protein
MKLGFNGIHRFPVFGGDTALLENIKATKRNTENLFEVDLQLRTDKNKYNLRPAATVHEDTTVQEDTIIPVIYTCLINHSKILQKSRD